MSEWKWCQNGGMDWSCNHRFSQHEDASDAAGVYKYQGPCTVDGCNCEEGYYDLADLL